MSDLVPPHGGLVRPVNRTVPADRVAEFDKEIASLPALPVSDADLSSVYRIGDGGLSPLTGPMVKYVYDQVLRDANIDANGGKYAWTIPISLPVEKAQVSSLRPGKKVRLVNAAGEAVGCLRIDDIFPWDKSAYLESVYQTKRTDHPGGRMVLSDTREMLFEPNAQEVLEALLPFYVNRHLYQLMLSAKASEHSARMVAMKTAKDNATKLLGDLTLEYNKARQAAITQEILEIAAASFAA